MKKAQVNQLTGFALTIMVFAVVLAVGLSVMTELYDSEVTTSSRHDGNESFTGLVGSFIDYDDATYNCLSCSNLNIYNNSGTNITSSFVLSNANCSANLTVSAENNTVMTANYTCSFYTYSASANATSESLTAVSELPGWTPVIIIAVVGGLVLFLVVKRYS